MLRQTAGFGLIRAEKFPWLNKIHYDVFYTAQRILLVRGGFLYSGEMKRKWTESVESVLLYSGDCSVRWKIVIGGKGQHLFFLSYS